MYELFTVSFDKKTWRKIKNIAMNQYPIIEDTIVDMEKIKNIVLSKYLNEYMRKFLDEDVTLITFIGKQKADVFADRKVFDKLKKSIENDIGFGVYLYRFPQMEPVPKMLKPSGVRYIYAMKPEMIDYEYIVDVLKIIKPDIEIREISTFNSMTYINNNSSYEGVIEIVVDFKDYEFAELIDLFMSEKMLIVSCDSCKLSQYGTAYMEVTSGAVDYRRDGEMYYL